jgi:quinol monooxygenase YgiN
MSAVLHIQLQVTLSERERMEEKTMIVFQVTFLVLPGNEAQAMKILFRHAEDATKEPGILVTRVYRSRTDPRRFSILHELTDAAALNHHRSSERYGGPIITHLYNLIDVDSLYMDTYELLTPQDGEEACVPQQESQEVYMHGKNTSGSH